MYTSDPCTTPRLKELVFSGLPPLFDTSLQLTGTSVCLYGIKHAPNGSPALDLPGKVVAGSWAGELDRLTVQGCIPEEVTEVLKQLQQLIGRILEYGNNFCSHHVVHDEERRLERKAEAVVTQESAGGEAVPSFSLQDTADPIQISLQCRRIPHAHTNPFCYSNASTGTKLSTS